MMPALVSSSDSGRAEAGPTMPKKMPISSEVVCAAKRMSATPRRCSAAASFCA